jgi:hypothetical protein
VFWAQLLVAGIALGPRDAQFGRWRRANGRRFARCHSLPLDAGGLAAALARPGRGRSRVGAVKRLAAILAVLALGCATAPKQPSQTAEKPLLNAPVSNPGRLPRVTVVRF